MGGLSLSSPPHLPCGSSLWFCPQEEGGRKEGGWGGSEPHRCRGGGVSLPGLCCPAAARLGGSGGTSLSRGMKTLSPFPVASDGLTPLPSIATRTVPLPSPWVGGVGASRPLPFPSWAGFEFGDTGGIHAPGSQTPPALSWRGQTDPIPVPCHLPSLGHAFQPRGPRLSGVPEGRSP